MIKTRTNDVNHTLETHILIIIIALMFSAFFSGVEIAYISMNKLKLELLKNGNSLTGRILSGFADNSARFLGMTLLGNNLALIILGTYTSILFDPLLVSGFRNWLGESADVGFLVLISQTIITTVMVLFFGEFIPKALFRIDPTAILTCLAVPLKAIDYVLWIPVWLIMTITDFILKYVLRVDIRTQSSVYSRVDLEEFVHQFVKNNEKEDEEIDTEIFEKAMSLTDLRIKECMIPRTEVVAIDISSSIEDLKELILESKHSKILVYEDNVDTIKGYVHHFDLLKKPETIDEILFPIKVVPESMGARDLLNLFIKDQRSIAWVVDEFGGTAGIVTLEDILEEIFGEIHDEHDSEDLIERQISDNEYIFSGRLEIDHLNDKYELNIPEGEYETLGGFIVAFHESIPQQSEVIVIGNFEFKMIAVSDTRIETVKMIVLNSGE